MAIDTNDKKLAVMDWCQVWEPAIPLDEAAGFDQGDKQQMLWGYPGISWGAPPDTPEGDYIHMIRRRFSR